jgi:hypothetical protein
MKPANGEYCIVNNLRGLNTNTESDFHSGYQR